MRGKEEEEGDAFFYGLCLFGFTLGLRRIDTLFFWHGGRCAVEQVAKLCFEVEVVEEGGNSAAFWQGFFHRPPLLQVFQYMENTFDREHDLFQS